MAPTHLLAPTARPSSSRPTASKPTVAQPLPPTTVHGQRRRRHPTRSRRILPRPRLMDTATCPARVAQRRSTGCSTTRRRCRAARRTSTESAAVVKRGHLRRERPHQGSRPQAQA
eukprot:scaffold58453_cov85-Phaeocystis_antarctica.AAC.7